MINDYQTLPTAKYTRKKYRSQSKTNYGLDVFMNNMVRKEGSISGIPEIGCAIKTCDS